MANPQPTDAHLRVAHSINEAIMLRDFSKRQRKILDLILRLSWGCHKKYAYIPLQKDFQVAGVYEGDIKKEIDWLKASNIIYQEGAFYWFNKNFDEWQISRVKTGSPEELKERLNDLIDKNLRKKHQREFAKHEVRISETRSETLQNTKSPTPNSDTAKEILKKSLNKSYIVIFEFWNSLNIIKHSKLTDDAKRAINATLENYSQEEIIRAIRNYGEILADEKYYFKYRWTLKDFLKRGLEKFLDIQIAKQNYQREKGGDIDGTFRGNSKAGRGFPQRNSYKSPEEHRKAGGY